MIINEGESQTNDDLMDRIHISSIIFFWGGDYSVFMDHNNN